MIPKMKNNMEKKFLPITIEELNEILGQSVKFDNENKLITFFAQLSAFTEEDQFNVSFNAPSSTGKSYIPLEVASLFPTEDLMELGYCSPQSFFHDAEADAETGEFIKDLSRKIIVFIDQPNPELLSRLRPILSHDRKEIMIKITDKKEKKGMRTKTVKIIGYPSVIHCSAGLRIDEQESTRMFLLSPETSQEKLRAAIHEKARKESNRELYKYQLWNNEKRLGLQERIKAIRDAHINQIVISDYEAVFKKFTSKHSSLKPRDTRDIGRVFSLAKMHALLNLWDRKRVGSGITATEDDVEIAFQIWDSVSESQELNLAPYVLQFHRQIMISANNESGYSTKKDVVRTHFEVYGRPLDDWRFRNQIIPSLEAAGLINVEKDPNDARSNIYRPIKMGPENNSEQGWGSDLPPLDN
jgi:hypothetical protein